MKTSFVFFAGSYYLLDIKTHPYGLLEDFLLMIVLQLGMLLLESCLFKTNWIAHSLAVLDNIFLFAKEGMTEFQIASGDSRSSGPCV